MSDARRDAPATSRNRAPILDALRRVLPTSGTVLEIASGTGQHAVFFARSLPGLAWQPSDVDPGARASIAAWVAAEGAPPNVRPPLDLDVMRRPWPIESADAVVAINLLHIAPPPIVGALVAGAAALLPAGGRLFLYGPFRRRGAPMEPSNRAFNADLRRRNATWGLRALEDVAREADGAGLSTAEVISMPANNLAVLFEKRRA